MPGKKDNKKTSGFGFSFDAITTFFGETKHKAEFTHIASSIMPSSSPASSSSPAESLDLDLVKLNFSVAGLSLIEQPDESMLEANLQRFLRDAERRHKLFVDYGKENEVIFDTNTQRELDENPETLLAKIKTIPDYFQMTVSLCHQQGYASNLIAPIQGILAAAGIAPFKLASKKQSTYNEKEIYCDVANDSVIFIEKNNMDGLDFSSKKQLIMPGVYIKTTQVIDLDGHYKETPQVELCFPKYVLGLLAAACKTGTYSTDDVNQLPVERAFLDAVELAFLEIVATNTDTDTDKFMPSKLISSAFDSLSNVSQTWFAQLRSPDLLTNSEAASSSPVTTSSEEEPIRPTPGT